jgi:hypothetical protein
MFRGASMWLKPALEHSAAFPVVGTGTGGFSGQLLARRGEGRRPREWAG